MDEQLTDRKKRILKAIIKTYMETGEPVGSRTISKDADLNVSSATIRNEMSDLTDMGYIVQPHTSAGRIPSDKGYRLYVDELMREKEDEIAEIRNLMIEKTDKMEKVLEVKCGEYYVDMAVAWYMSFTLIKQWDDAIKVIEEKKLNVWVHNKSIQKAIESYRIPDDKKTYLKTLKIHE